MFLTIWGENLGLSTEGTSGEIDGVDDVEGQLWYEGDGEGRGMGALATVISLSLQLCSQRLFVKSERAVTRLSQPWSCHEHSQTSGSMTLLTWSGRGAVTGWSLVRSWHSNSHKVACHYVMPVMTLSWQCDCHETQAFIGDITVLAWAS